MGGLQELGELHWAFCDEGLKGGFALLIILLKQLNDDFFVLLEPGVQKRLAGSRPLGWVDLDEAQEEAPAVLGYVLDVIVNPCEIALFVLLHDLHLVCPREKVPSCD